MSQNSPKIPFVKAILCLMMVYLLSHVSSFLPGTSNSIFPNLSLQTLAYAEEDEFDEEDEDEEEDEEEWDYSNMYAYPPEYYEDYYEDEEDEDDEE